MKNSEITLNISIKRKDGTKGSTKSIRKDSTGTKWTGTGANGKTYKYSPEQLLSHLFKGIIFGKVIIEVVSDSPDDAVKSGTVVSIDKKQ